MTQSLEPHIFRALRMIVDLDLDLDLDLDHH